MMLQILLECFWLINFKGINSFDYIEQIGSVNKDYTEQVLNEVFAENKMVLSVINTK